MFPVTNPLLLIPVIPATWWVAEVVYVQYFLAICSPCSLILPEFVTVHVFILRYTRKQSRRPPYKEANTAAANPKGSFSVSTLTKRNHPHVIAVTQRCLIVLIATLRSSLSVELRGRGTTQRFCTQGTEIIPGSGSYLTYARMTLLPARVRSFPCL